MIFTITDAGLAAIAAGGPNGPYINLTSFKFGSAFNYTPLLTQTGLNGTTVSQGPLANYRVIDSNTVEYIIRSNESIGDFTFGEIGLYTASGVLFAIAALETLQPKIRSLGPQVGNIVEIECRIVLTTNVTAVFQFPINSNSNELIPEIANLQLLDTPSTSGSNVFIVHDIDDCGNSGIAYRHNNFEWSFSTHLCNFVGTIGAGTTNTSIVSSSLTYDNISETDVIIPKKYILQFTTGALKGTLKYIDSRISSTTILVNPATAGTAAVGDQFIVHKSICCGDNSLLFAGALEYNAFATRINRVIGAPTGSTDTDNFGYGQVPIPLIPIPQRPSRPQWDLLYNKLDAGRAHQIPAVSLPLAPVFTPTPVDYFQFSNSNPSGQGLATTITRYNNLDASISLMTSSRSAAADLQVTIPPSGTRIRTTGWSTSIQHSALFQFPDSDSMKAFFNAGGSIQHAMSIINSIDVDDVEWSNMVANIGIVYLGYDRTRSNLITSSIGFYDLGSSLVQILNTPGPSSPLGPKSYSLFASRPFANAVQIVGSLVGRNRAGAGGSSGAYPYSNTSASASTRSYMGFQKSNNSFLNDPPVASPIIIDNGSTW